MATVANDLRVNPDAHRAQVHRWNDTSTSYPRTATVPERFAQQADIRPDAVAVRQGTEQLTYRELRDQVAALADRLVADGVEPGDVVGVLLERSVACVTAVLAVMRAGAAYLPLDPHYPQQHLLRLLQDAHVRKVITRATHRPLVEGHAETVDVADRPVRTGASDQVDAGPDDPAYVIFTSGSTGVPKGAVVPHRGPVRLVCHGDERLRLSSRDVLLATTNPTFDVSCFEWFAALLNGARLVLAEGDTLLAADALEDTLRAEGVSVMWLSAGLFHQMAKVRPEMFAPLRCLIAGGDALSPEAVRRVLAHGRPGMLVNGYGPTENSSLSTVHVMTELPDDAETVPIGTPVANSTAYVVREDGDLAAPGQTGELWVGGDGVALGYLRDEELTTRRFVPDHLSPDDESGTLYKTGDLARWRPDGVLEFLGRRDRQVKVRGYRIELDEIEVHLSAHEQVREAAVITPQGGERDRLLAWVTPQPGADAAELGWRLREYLRDRLPVFMVPQPILVRDRMPLNRSGKIDRALLAQEADRHDTAARTAGQEAVTPVEKAVAELWAEILGIEGNIGRERDFFALGGHSLQATRLAARCRARFDLAPEHSRYLIRTLLANPTVETFAARIEELATATVEDTQEQTVDFEAAARLDPDLVFPTATHLPSTGRRVVLSGATGFLGTYLLDSLIRDHGAAHVYCLVRARSEAEGRQRLAARMRRYGLDLQAVGEHVTVVPGDLGAPRFGLAPVAFHALGEDSDTLLHAGSRVNFAYPYAALEAINVGGTRTMLDLARIGPAKAFHYVSSIAVIAGFGVAGVRHVDEDTPLRFADRISLGYPETKWVAERLVAQAAQQGLAAAVHRPYEITGTQDGGIWNTDTMMCALFRSIAETGLAPDIELPLDFVPVDYTAKAITHILAHRPAHGQVHHITNPHDARLPLLTERLRARGYPVRSVPYEEWVAFMADLTARDPSQPMAPFMPMFIEPAHQSDISVKEMYFAGTFPSFSRTTFEAAIDGSGLTCPPVDAAMLDPYLDYFTDSGFLQPPAAASGSA
ncbi:amino acid adenylation domain-containing SDR family oxidoreductase [Streptomyces formicae]|uniref:Non-ribosomal peptide synthetase n=1 Tax=Streptomyces formicae TaxID=1616117 RepID=A0A291QND7_9ACTN|nr:amino acid adenylation domain-containing SDR family oxidoreductase [Streptomyces formicae]ATL33013.1 Non-ribosomal peptide synthetase [Streptomyces formicae]